jgi:Protein of unknown function (DUF2806)
MGDQSGESIVDTALQTIDSVAPDGWRMKFAKAAAQLIAGTEKGAIAYGQMRERIDTIEGRSTVSRALASAVAVQAVNDPELVERSKARFLGTAIQQQENIEAVVSGATQYLPMLPAPEIEAQSGTCIEQNDFDRPKERLDVGREQVADESPLNADWAATFSGIAENATTEELRDRLSRVLAGELASPGTYSRATVRAVAELERSDLESVQAVSSYILGKRLLPTRDPSRRPSVDTLLPLSDAGLITDANAMLSITSEPAVTDAQPIYFGGEDWGVVIFLNKGSQLDIPVIPLTRTGTAVIDLLGRSDEREILRRVVAELPESSYSKIVLGRKNDATE